MNGGVGTRGGIDPNRPESSMGGQPSLSQGATSFPEPRGLNHIGSTTSTRGPWAVEARPYKSLTSRPRLHEQGTASRHSDYRSSSVMGDTQAQEDNMHRLRKVSLLEKR